MTMTNPLDDDPYYRYSDAERRQIVRQWHEAMQEFWKRNICVCPGKEVPFYCPKHGQVEYQEWVELMEKKARDGQG